MVVEKFRRPRQVKPSRQLLRKAEKEDTLAIERAKEYVERIGGYAALEARHAALNAKYGGGNNPSRIPKGKIFNSGTYHEDEVPLRQLEAVSSTVRTAEGFLLLPGGFAKAIVPIPKQFRKAWTISAHSTSTFARCGVNIISHTGDRDRQLTRRILPSTMAVMLHNWSKTPVLVRERDPVRLLNSDELMGSIAGAAALKTSPRTSAIGKLIKLHAGNEVILVNDAALHSATVDGEQIKYVDPHASNFSEQFTTARFIQLSVKPGDFVVISTRERKVVPAGHVALVHDATDHLRHTTARLLHSGSKGITALEFRAVHEGTIKPGDHVAFLTAHAVNTGKAPYAGRYHGEESAVPKGKS